MRRAATVMMVSSALACASPTASAQSVPQTSVAPAPNSLAAQAAGPWRHIPKPVSDQKFKQDKAKCAMMGEMAPVDAGSPYIKFLAVFIECMR